jgi:hypothetical protein
MGLVVALSRVFSTALMHGSATALTGIALGRLRFGRGTSRLIDIHDLRQVVWAKPILTVLSHNSCENLSHNFCENHHR